MKIDPATLFYLFRRKKRLDADARAYFERAGVTDGIARQQVSNLFRRLKAEGLWDSIAEGWSFRTPQNTGTGTIARGFRGAADFTLFNGATWDGAGISFDGLSQWAQAPAPLYLPRSVFAIFRLDGAQSSRPMICGLQSNSASGVVFVGTGGAGSNLGMIDYSPSITIVGPAGPIYGGTYTSAATIADNVSTKIFKNGAPLASGGVVTEDSNYGGTRLANHGFAYIAVTMVAMLVYEAALNDMQIATLHAVCKETIAEDLPLV